MIEYLIRRLRKFYISKKIVLSFWIFTDFLAGGGQRQLCVGYWTNVWRFGFCVTDHWQDQQPFPVFCRSLIICYETCRRGSWNLKCYETTSFQTACADRYVTSEWHLLLSWRAGGYTVRIKHGVRWNQKLSIHSFNSGTVEQIQGDSRDTMSCKTYVLNIRVIKLIKLKARLKIGRKFMLLSKAGIISSWPFPFRVMWIWWEGVCVGVGGGGRCQCIKIAFLQQQTQGSFCRTLHINR